MIGRGGVLLLLMLVTGCATIEAPPPDERAQRLLDADRWQCRGRVAVKTSSDGGQGNLVWSQEGDSSVISVSGPFRTGALDIRATPDGTTVRNSRDEIVSTMDGPGAADQLIREALGWPFPATSARFWLLGVLDPASPGKVRRDESGGLAGLEQHGWVVSIGRYAEVDGERLPTRLVLESGSTRIRVVIHKWTLATLN